MDLRSGQPFWIAKNGLLRSYPPLVANEECDILIVGGGITGALTADFLSTTNGDVVLLDSRDVGGGSTAASTSLLQYGIDTELADLIERIGERDAVRAYRLGLEAIDTVEQLVAELGDTCGFARRPSIYLASRKSDVRRLRQEYELREAHGFDVSWLTPGDIEASFPFTAPAAILSAEDAEVDAFRLTHRLLERAASRGVRVYDRTKALRFETVPQGHLIHTDRDTTVIARRVVFATGYESHKYLKKNVGTLHSTYALASEPLSPFPRWRDRALIWETSRPYFYMRTTPDDRVIIGGEDTAFAEDHKRDHRIDKKCRKLISRFATMFPETRFEIAYAWAGTFGETKDGLAYVGTPTDQPGTYFALGYGGNGITMSVTAAKIITDLCAGWENPDAQLFQFGR